MIDSVIIISISIISIVIIMYKYKLNKSRTSSEYNDWFGLFKQPGN